jgi:hypothetical protein
VNQQKFELRLSQIENNTNLDNQLGIERIRREVLAREKQYLQYYHSNSSTEKASTATSKIDAEI